VMSSCPGGGAMNPIHGANGHYLLKTRLLSDQVDDLFSRCQSVGSSKTYVNAFVLEDVRFGFAFCNLNHTNCFLA